MRSFRQSFLRLLTITTIANKGQELFNIFRQFLASVGTSFFDLRYFCFCNGLKKYLFHSVRTKNVYNGSARYQMKSEPSRDYGTMTVYLWFRRPNAHGKLKKKKLLPLLTHAGVTDKMQNVASPISKHPFINYKRNPPLFIVHSR